MNLTKFLGCVRFSRTVCNPFVRVSVVVSPEGPEGRLVDPLPEAQVLLTSVNKRREPQGCWSLRGGDYFVTLVFLSGMVLSPSQGSMTEGKIYIPCY